MTRSCIKKDVQTALSLTMRWVARKWPRTLLFHVGCTFLLLLGNNHLGRGSAQCPLPLCAQPALHERALHTKETSHGWR